MSTLGSLKANDKVQTFESLIVLSFFFFNLSWTLRLQNSFILKVEHTEGKSPI